MKSAHRHFFFGQDALCLHTVIKGYFSQLVAYFQNLENVPFLKIQISLSFFKMRDIIITPRAHVCWQHQIQSLQEVLRGRHPPNISLCSPPPQGPTSYYPPDSESSCQFPFIVTPELLFVMW